MAKCNQLISLPFKGLILLTRLSFSRRQTTSVCVFCYVCMTLTSTLTPWSWYLGMT